MEIPQIARCFPDTNLQQPCHDPMTIGGLIPRSHRWCMLWSSCSSVKIQDVSKPEQDNTTSVLDVHFRLSNNPVPTGRGFHQHHVVPSVRNRGDRGRELGGHLPLPERLQDYLLNANPSEAKQVRQSRLLVRSISF